MGQKTKWTLRAALQWEHLRLQMCLLAVDGSPMLLKVAGLWTEAHLAGLTLVLLEDGCVFIIDTDNLTGC